MDFKREIISTPFGNMFIQPVFNGAYLETGREGETDTCYPIVVNTVDYYCTVNAKHENGKTEITHVYMSKRYFQDPSEAAKKKVREKLQPIVDKWIKDNMDKVKLATLDSMRMNVQSHEGDVKRAQEKLDTAKKEFNEAYLKYEALYFEINKDYPTDLNGN